MASNVTTRVDIQDIELGTPFHPPTNFRFPTKTYGSRNRCCQHSWFTECSFLHYDIELDAVFCHTCQRAVREKKIRSSTRSDQAFVRFILILNRYKPTLHCSSRLDFQTGKMDWQKLEVMLDLSTTKKQTKLFLFYPNRPRTLVSSLILAMPAENLEIERYF